MKPPTVYMRQVMPQLWRIESVSTGNVIIKNIVLSSVPQAIEFVSNYVSSFSCWTYEIIELKDK